jgi:hypothetical protein
MVASCTVPEGFHHFVQLSFDSIEKLEERLFSSGVQAPHSGESMTARLNAASNFNEHPGANWRNQPGIFVPI